MPTLMNFVELQQALSNLAGWRLENGSLMKEWTFADFTGALAFVNLVATQAERAGHHPDIDIRYNQVRLSLVSHDAGGITHRDLALAKEIAALDHN